MNHTIAAAEALTGDDAIRNRIIGEALFLRALNYFDLVRIYSYEPTKIVGGWDKGVVLRTEPTRTSEDASFIERSTVVETYQLIEADLLRSIQLLGQGDRGVFFANHRAAQALLARVYLYWDRWDDAIAMATAAMQDSRARLATAGQYVSMWGAVPNVESIWELNYELTESVWVNNCQACYVHPSGTWQVSIIPSAELLALYEPGDIRLGVLPATTTPGSMPIGTRYTTKFANYRGANTDNVPMLRYSEMLLIRAEAHAMRGREVEARADLNTLRAARNASPITATGDALIQALLAERRRELVYEGHRFFDLKRRGLDITKPAMGNWPTVPYTDFRLLAAIPDAQIQNNPKLVQNPGY
jgi:hypothetical protein